MQDFVAALCLLLVFEGLLPFISPTRWRNTMRQLTEFDDRTLRFVGFISMAVGLVLLQWVR